MNVDVNGREPELQREDDGKAPMLGGARRQWSSLAAYLMTQQHRAHRAQQMQRVWALRRMREAIRLDAVKRQYKSVRTGVKYEGMTDSLALSAIRRDLKIAKEQLAMYQEGNRWGRVKELRAIINVIEEVVYYWEARLDTPC